MIGSLILNLNSAYLPSFFHVVHHLILGDYEVLPTLIPILMVQSTAIEIQAFKSGLNKELAYVDQFWGFFLSIILISNS